MEKIGVVVGAVPIGSERSRILSLIKDERAYSIAADGGIQFFIESDIVPDEWVGDMDSTDENIRTEYRKCSNVTMVSPIKDETDMELALNRLFDKGCTKAYIFGGTGGKREEHTFANIQLIHGFSRKGKKVVMISEDKTFEIITDGRLDLGNRKSGFVSVFSLTDKSLDVTIDGLFYEYKGTLTNTYALGVSNEFCGKDAFVSVGKGSLLIVYDN